MTQPDRPAALGVLAAACVSALVVNANTSAVTILLPSISRDTHSVSPTRAMQILLRRSPRTACGARATS